MYTLFRLSTPPRQSIKAEIKTQPSHIRLEGLAGISQRIIVFCVSTLSPPVFQDALEHHLE